MLCVNADGWNEMLVEAMWKRAAKDQAEVKHTWFMWEFVKKCKQCRRTLTSSYTYNNEAQRNTSRD